MAGRRRDMEVDARVDDRRKNARDAGGAVMFRARRRRVSWRAVAGRLSARAGLIEEAGRMAGALRVQRSCVRDNEQRHRQSER